MFIIIVIYEQYFQYFHRFAYDHQTDQPGRLTIQVSDTNLEFCRSGLMLVQHTKEPQCQMAE